MLPTERNSQGTQELEFHPPSTALAFGKRTNPRDRSAMNDLWALAILGTSAAEVPDILEAVQVPHAHDKDEANQRQHVVPAGFTP